LNREWIFASDLIITSRSIRSYKNN